jgi:NCS2 family nucleobase:cation symporter-2
MRPSNLIYSVDEKPPAPITFANAAQQLTIFAPILVYTMLVMRAGGVGEEGVAHAVSLTFAVCGVAIILQAWPGRRLGSGYLITVAPAAPYIPISIAAIKAGGLPLLAGMTMTAGVFEIGISQVVRRFRAFFPAEISGLCIVLIGIFIGVLAVRSVFGYDTSTTQATASTTELLISGGTLALMIGLNLWAKGRLRMLCGIIGVASGYIACVAFGAVDPAAMKVLAAAPWFALPPWQPKLPIIRLDLLIPFFAAALTCALRGMGDISVAQKINDRDWIRPNMTSIQNGIAANGFSTILAGLAGGLGGNTQSSGIGMSNAAGVTSRWVAYWLGGMLIVCSFVPVVSGILVALPRAVIGAVFIFTSCFITINGLQVITSRLLDARRTFIVGIALTVSLGHEIYPALYAKAPAILQPFVSSGLVVGLITALLLNAVFRIGVRTKAAIVIKSPEDAHDAVRSFLEQQGAKWGARRDVTERAIFGTAQSIESIIDHCNVQGPITVEAGFDEFNLDIRVTYNGDDFVLPERRPTDEQIRETDEGLRLLAGYLIQRNADRVRISRKGDSAAIDFHYQH